MTDAGREASRPETRRLTDISRALTYARSLDEVVELTVECALDVLGATRAVLMLTGEDGLLRIEAARGVDDAVVDRFREPLDENLLSRLTAVLGPHAKSSFLGVPLVVQGEVTGLLGVLLGDSPPPAEEAEWLLSAVADQAAVALESTRHQEVRESLRGRVDDLERKQRSKDEAMEILSHDLRSPLSAIQGYVSLLLGEILGPVNERQQEALGRLKGVTGHMQSLLDSILELANLTGGRVELHTEATTLADVVRTALDIVRPAAEEAEIGVASVGDEPVELRTDPGRLRQVLVHLLDNAVKYSAAGSTVRVVFGAEERDGGPRARVEVRDRGPGIPKERHEAIFEPYNRQDGATDRARSGVGLGLALARGLVRRMGGSLWVESEPGEGSTFVVLLPLEPSDRAGLPARDARP